MTKKIFYKFPTQVSTVIAFSRKKYCRIKQVS